MTERYEPSPARLVAARVVCAACLGLMLSCSGNGGDGTTAGDQPESEAVVEPTPVVPVEPTSSGDTGPEAAAAMSVQVVEVYFPSAADDGLVAEAREIFVTAAPGDRAKQILADLISGPTTDLALRALPRGTRLRQIYVLENGVAYIDFSDDLREGLGGGSSEELLAVYAIVDSVVLNIPEIRRVAILINGEPVDTLNGHMDLRRPLPPNIELIVGRITQAEPGPESAAVASNERDGRPAAEAASGS